MALLFLWLGGVGKMLEALLGWSGKFKSLCLVSRD